MLARASFRNFKGLRHLDVELEPFTVFVGKNGSGKTSILQGIHYASQIGARRPGEEKNPAGRLGALFSGPRHLHRLVSTPGRGPLEIALTDTTGATLSLSAALPPEDEDGMDCRFHASVSGAEAVSIELPGSDPATLTAFFKSSAVRRFASAAFLHLDASVMVRPSAVESEEVPRVEHDGEGLASVLSYLAGAEPDTLDAILKDLKRIVPQVRGIRTFPASVTRRRRERIAIDDQAIWRSFEEQVPGHKFSLDFGTGRVIPADLLSEGTVLALGLLVVLRQPRCPRLVLLDDLDSALHMEAQAELIHCLRDVLSARPDLQISCTSHSPYLLDNFKLEEVRLTALDAAGNTVCRPLHEHREVERWKKMLRPGELWASVGEEWLVKEQSDG